MREIKRGYAKWYDSDGVLHKEPAYLHPDLLALAGPKEQAFAEEVRKQDEANGVLQVEENDNNYDGNED